MGIVAEALQLQGVVSLANYHNLFGLAKQKTFKAVYPKLKERDVLCSILRRGRGYVPLGFRPRNGYLLL